MAKTVLIVEDNELNMKLFHDLLEAHGYATVGTRNGIEALDLARKHRPDLILMDIQMPEMNGFEATSAIRAIEKAGSRVSIVAMTAHAMKGDRERCIAAGMDDYLSKPIRAKQLIELVEREAVPAAVLVRQTNELGLEETALLELVHGNVDIALELASAFLEESPALLAKLREALESQDAKTVNYVAHALKGAVANFGAKQPIETAFALEQLGKNRQLETA